MRHKMLLKFLARLHVCTSDIYDFEEPTGVFNTSEINVIQCCTVLRTVRKIHRGNGKIDTNLLSIGIKMGTRKTRRTGLVGGHTDSYY